MTSERRVSSWLRARAAAFAALLAVVVVLLGRPIVEFPTHTFGAFDIFTQASTWTRVDDEHVLANQLLSDPAAEMYPWSLFSARELASGRMPLWNPHSSTGLPLLANYQSAVLSPFSLPFYVLPLKAALLASALLKLLATALFAFLFLERIGCTRGAALVGATALAASGMSLLLLPYPHTGVFACLPAALYFVAVLFDRAETDASKLLAPSAGLALALGVAALAGHPETLLFLALVVVLYSAHRWLALRRTNRDVTWRVVGLLCAAALVGIALGAVQIVPFAEYLARSQVVHVNRGVGVPLARENWPLHLFPNLAGLPMGSRLFRANLPKPNYEEVTTFFVGGATLLCAVLALARLHRDPRARFFALLVAVWLVYGYDLGGIGSWLTAHTPLRLIPMHRTQPLWTPSVCFLAAIGVGALEQPRDRWRVRRVLACLAVAAVIALVFTWGALRYWSHLAAELELGELFDPKSPLELPWMLALFAVAALGLAAIVGSPLRAARNVGYGAVIASIVLGSATSIADYVPTVEDRFVLPRTPALDELQRLVGDERVVMLSSDRIVPDVSLDYGLNVLGSYDALAVHDYVRLSDHFFGCNFAQSEPRRATKRGLELFGVRYVTARSEWVAIDTDLGDDVVDTCDCNAYLADEWLGPAAQPIGRGKNESLRFDLVASRDRLDALAVQFVLSSAASNSTIAYRLIDVDSGRELVRGSKRMDELPRVPGERWELVARFDELAHSAGRKLAFELDTPDTNDATRPRIAKRIWTGVDRATIDPRAPRPKIDLGYAQHEFEPLGLAGKHEVYRYERSPGRAWIVGSARAATTHEQAFELVTAAAFDPLASVVVEDAHAPTTPSAGPFELARLDETTQSLHFRARCGSPGWLVLAQTFYPGWSATIDGAPSDLRRANYAFTALALPAGEHDVRITYAPASFRIGAALSLAGLACVIGALVVARRRA